MNTWMKHPKLPKEQIIQVTDDAVEANRRAGWEVTDPPPEPTGSDLETAAGDENPASVPDTDTAAVNERPKKSNTAKDGKES